MSEAQQSTNRPINAIQRSPDRVHPKTYKDHQCVRIKRNGERCQKPPILGGAVCRFHGGAASHVKLAAKARLENAADRMAEQLLGIALNEEMKPEVRLAAIKDALDRAGLSPRQALDVVHELKPWEQVLDGVLRGPRVDPPGGGRTLDTEVIDGEVIEYTAFGAPGDDGRSA